MHRWDFSLTAPVPSRTFVPGGVAVFPIKLRNTGNIVDNCRISVAVLSGFNWKILGVSVYKAEKISDIEVEVFACHEAIVTLGIYPRTGAGETTHTDAVNVESKSHPGIRRSISLALSVLKIVGIAISISPAESSVERGDEDLRNHAAKHWRGSA